MFIGIEALVQLVGREGVNNDRYYVGAAQRMLTTDVKKYVVVASLVSYPVEAFSLGILEGDRFFLRAAELWGVVVSEYEYVSTLPLCVWSVAAEAVTETGLHGKKLRSVVFDCMGTSIGYLDRNCYACLRTFPLCLTQGDIEANLIDLLRADTSDSDYMTKKIRFCMEFFPCQCKLALRLLADAPCSIALVEKGHAAGSFCEAVPPHDRPGAARGAGLR